ncbi:MAG: sodium/alanine symporter [Gammaproteobacteria bacterium]|jgi:AGCS family alanine or glycine:cation symporter|nr:sodium/alanine symporter [Gammaproteobacteria bacterium]|tara:strand:- start:3226 stop:4563 length:1338 start_codon:yes stop_codon:yes gene_type:complete
MENFINDLAVFVWTWNVPILVGSGIFFLIYSKLTPFKYIIHAFNLIRGKYSSKEDIGQVTHFQALTTALSGTIGLGNIAGVAIAIKLAGPGAIFWMWLTAIVGIATKFFTCTLSVMYRDVDEYGNVNGGPMYVIKNALPASMLPLAYFFAAAGLIGALPGFQSNQLVQIMGDLPMLQFENFNLIAGVVLAIITGVIILGGLIRIAKVSEWLVPLMSVLYFGSTVVALVLNFEDVIPAFKIIIEDAFTGSAVAGGSVIAVIIMGVRRGAHSNEAGIGTETLVHGSAKTSDPVKQGLVAMLGPIFDTLIMCTSTALLIIISGVWLNSDANGVTLTAEAFSMLLGPIGYAVLFICVISFGATTIFTYSYYGSACSRFLFGEKGVRVYQWIIIFFVIVFAVIPIEAAINIIDISFALMAIPTLISSVWLAPKVIERAKAYFAALELESS